MFCGASQMSPKLITSHSGYDPEAKNPYYGKPDQEVTDKVSSNFILDHLRIIFSVHRGMKLIKVTAVQSLWTGQRL